MKVYVYLDESGSIHKNSRTKYFAIGGYFTFKSAKNKIISTYKKINKSIKDERNISLDKEIKSYDMLDIEKISIFKNIQSIDGFYGIAKVFKKELMKKEIIESNIFFNYGVRLLFKDCIIPLLKNYKNIEFIISIDNRNIRINDLNNLEVYLNTEFCIENYSFKVTYYDSASNYGIQMADLIVNTFYNLYKDKKMIKDVIKVINKHKFRISTFPGFKVQGRIRKIIVYD